MKRTSNIKRRPNRSYRVKGGTVARIQRTTYGSKDDWRELCQRVKVRDRHTCQGRNCGSTNKSILQVHHILPLSRGGKNTMTNLITLCDNCHSKRHKHMH